MSMRKCTKFELFKRGGIEHTPHRELVLRIFADQHKALAPKDVLSTVRKKQAIDKVTLYRILDLFVAKGILRRFSTNGSTRYEINCEEHAPSHPHFVCRQCGEIECLHDFNLKNFKTEIKRYKNIEYEDIDLKLEGVCHQCKEK